MSADGVSQRQIFDKTIQANQLNVVEAHGILLFRAERGMYTTATTTTMAHAFPVEIYCVLVDAYTIRDAPCAFTLVFYTHIYIFFYSTDFRWQPLPSVATIALATAIVIIFDHGLPGPTPLLF